MKMEEYKVSSRKANAHFGRSMRVALDSCSARTFQLFDHTMYTKISDQKARNVFGKNASESRNSLAAVLFDSCVFGDAASRLQNRYPNCPFSSVISGTSPTMPRRAEVSLVSCPQVFLCSPNRDMQCHAIPL